MMVGRKNGAVHVLLSNSSISGQHVAVWMDNNGRAWIEDRNSSNGTWLNNRKLTPLKPFPLANRDQLQLGDVLLTVSIL